MKQTGSLKIYILLHVLMLLFSLSPVCSKLASCQPFLSLQFFFFYGLVIFILGIYAVAWQQVLKYMPLTVAYANKAITVVWGMLWGILFFEESITVQKLFGAVIIVVGIMLYAFSESKKEIDKYE